MADEAQVVQELSEMLGVESKAGMEKVAESQVLKDAMKDLGGEVAESEEAQTQKFVHEPTGKTFDSREEYLQYNSGWTADKLGNENKALREQLEELRGKVEQVAETQQPNAPMSKRDLMKLVWDDAPDEVLDDPSMGMIYDGLNKVAGLLKQQFEAENAALKGEIAKLTERLQVGSLRSQLGVDEAVESKVLEKYPALKGLPIEQRLQLVKDLAGAPNQDKPPTNVPVRSAMDHIEESSPSVSDDMSVTSKLDEKFDEIAGTDAGMDFIKKQIKRQGGFFGMQDL